MSEFAISTGERRQVSDLAALAVFWMLFASSSIVHKEPAPFDLMFIFLFGASLLLGLRIPSSLFPVFLMMAVFLLFALLGATLGQQLSDSLRHVGITSLLCAVSVFVACVIYRYGERGLRAMLSGWTFAAIVASLLGILGYFHLLGGLSDEFTLYFRAKGTFKDPNVLAPYLVVPILFCIYEVLTRRGLRALFYLGVLGILLLALLLSFSRGGWAHFAVSALIAGMLWLSASKSTAFKAKLLLFAVAAAVAGSVALVFLIDIESIGKLFEIRAQLAQDYDSGSAGRFAGQIVTIQKILDNPLGLGALGFLPQWYEQPHNVYLFIFMMAGWFGGSAYVLFVLSTLVLGFRALARPGRCGGLLVILIASFAGVVLEGFVVDTDHWRHFWFLLGAILGVYALTRKADVPAQATVRPQTRATPAPVLRGTLD